MKMKFSLIALLAMFVISACSDDEAKKFSNEPDALAANDAAGEGIYKAVFIGSTGTILFDMDNEGDGDITAVLVLNNKSYKLSTEATFNQNGVFEGTFYGKKDVEDDIAVEVYVSETGEFTLLGITFPGHPDITYVVYKELSDAVVKVYEGTYSGTVSGTMNIVARMMENGNGSLIGVVKSSSPEAEASEIYGEVFEGGFMGGGALQFTGEIDGDNVGGTWEKGEGSGTWKVKRTL